VVDILVEIGETGQAARLAGVTGLPLEPLHPGTPDPALARWYRVAVPPGQDVDEITRRLLGDPYVEAAYTKPPEAAP
jgi:hypothetical protein